MNSDIAISIISSLKQAMLLWDQTSIVKSLNWLDTLIFGSVALSVAIVAVASIGFLMLAGRIDVRRSHGVILGCFLLFGAHAIASSLIPVASMPDAQPVISPAPTTIPVSVPYPNGTPKPYDPYAGAAVPER